jgi:four helix bundle protein
MANIKSEIKGHRDLIAWQKELDTHLEIALRLGYIEQKIYQPVQGQIQEVGRILNGLLRSIEG